jgi:hypothetical protein
MKKIHTLTGIAVFMAVAAQAATVVYQSDFTQATLAATGLTSSGDGGSWSLQTTPDRAEISAPGNPNRASLYTSNVFQSNLGFTLDATFYRPVEGYRFSIGIVEDSHIDYTKDWLNKGEPGAYGIGFATSKVATDLGYVNHALGFNDGTGTDGDSGGASVLSTDQGNNAYGTLQTLSMTVTGNSWSYSLNATAATTGSFTFDTSKSYRFIAYGQTSSGDPVDGSYFSDITLTAIPEPSSFALLGGLLALGHVMVRRRRR